VAIFYLIKMCEIIGGGGAVPGRMRNSGAEDVERQENRMVDNDNGVNNE
jgi:hypothetical protein